MLINYEMKDISPKSRAEKIARDLAKEGATKVEIVEQTGGGWTVNYTKP